MATLVVEAKHHLEPSNCDLFDNERVCKVLLITKDHKGKFVNLAELLRGNAEADRRTASKGGEISGQSKREMLNILSKLQYVSQYDCSSCRSTLYEEGKGFA